MPKTNSFQPLFFWILNLSNGNGGCHCHSKGCHLMELWVFFSPFKVCCICSLLDNEPLTYSGGYMFPDWAYHLGRAIALSSMVTVPIWTCVKLFLGKGTLRQARDHRHCLSRKYFLVCGLKCCFVSVLSVWRPTGILLLSWEKNALFLTSQRWIQCQPLVLIAKIQYKSLQEP